MTPTDQLAPDERLKDPVELSAASFSRFARFISGELGIKMPASKVTLVQSRLLRRVRDLRLESLERYAEYFFASGNGEEREHFINAITTNKTDFFREAEHFDYLVSKALPDLAERKGASRKSLIWSAGCSTGEEPYTLAMVLSEYSRGCPGFRFSVLATDICTAVLAKAATGIFKSELAGPVPRDFRRKYFMRSRDPESDLLRIVPEVRSLVEFRRLNFMDADFGLSELPEIVFCRNVIIYFDRDTQVRLVQKLTRQLAPGGYFFAGHSESLQGMDLPLFPVGPAVYRKPQ
jgi:chemotaxis protein methyltransferase CheR